MTGANAPLYSTDSLSVSNTIDYYIKLGMPPEKIILGMGAYGRSWTLNSAASNGMGSPANAPGLPGPVSPIISTYFHFFQLDKLRNIK